MTDAFRFADDLGPHKIIHVFNPGVGLRAILVVDNVATGPSIGGLRMAVDVSIDECVRLARAMTLKNAAAGLQHGGGKSVLFGDPKMDKPQKERLIRALACALRDERDYIFGPDMGTDEECMAWVHDEIGRAVGLPAACGGIPLDEIGATGWGLSHAVEVMARHCKIELGGATLVVQGFGAVGKHTARFLAKLGVVLVGAADSRGTLYDPEGIDIEALIVLKDQGKSVVDSPSGEKLTCDQIIDIPCDIWVPAARPDVVHEGNVHRLKARLVAQGANIPFTYQAEKCLHERGIVCIPDFIANAGGVICAAMEYHGAGRAAAFETIAEKIRANTEALAKRLVCGKTLPRDAALELARQRVIAAMTTRRWGIF